MSETQAPRILILENDPIELIRIFRELHRNGLEFHPDQVSSIQELEHKIQSVPPDLILTDFDSTVIDGFSALTVARRHYREVPFICLAETPGEETTIRAFEHGATDFILKSQLVKLAPAIRRTLRETRERRAHQRAKEHQENQLRASEERFRQLNEQLEQRVAQRTAELKQANRELEAFSYSVSHDLRAPLRHIQGFIEILQHELQPTLSSEHATHLQTVADSAEKMSELIESLLAFSRLGRVPLHKQAVDLNQLLRSVRSEFGRELTTRRIHWVVEELPEVDGDPGLLHQVFVNLISNALKYSRTRPETRIRISHDQKPKEWVLFVQDNGVGFDPRLAPRLFGVFQRLHPPSEFEGTGIGLANVQRIIQRHGGRVWAEGLANKGATFCFTLPR